MKILVLGSTGMLGNQVAKVLIDEFGEKAVVGTWRNEKMNWMNRSVFFDAGITDIQDVLTSVEPDYVINCIGIIKPFMKDIESAVTINSIFPYKLAKECKESDIALIHISTDCVYSGRVGDYNETRAHDALDDYGKTKSLGEPVDLAMVIRTSIIGPELHKHASLLAWALSVKDQDVMGFSNHKWNGMTTRQYGHTVAQIIKDKLYQEGLYHLFSDTVTKAELLDLFSKVFDLNLNIEVVDAGVACDRTLSSKKSLINMIDIPDLKDQLLEIKPFIDEK